jgi:autotransporter-associated beta strand protein
LNVNDYLSIARYGGSGALNVNGGWVNAWNRHITVGESGDGAMNIYGGGVYAPHGVALSGNGGSKGSLDLSGGQLVTAQIFKYGGTGNLTLNGGTLKATRDEWNFISGLNSANIGTNGALIDNDGKSIAINQTLTGSGSGSVKFDGSNKTTLRQNNTYTGDTLVRGGILQFYESGSLYNNGTAAGNIYVESGASLYFNRENVFGTARSSSPVTITVNNGGLVQNDANFNNINNLTLNGGELRANGGNSARWQAYALNNVTIGGSNASSITANTSLNTNNAIFLSLIGTTTFNVGVTGDGRGDLLVSAKLTDGDGVAGSITKTGLGTMVLSGSNTYSGGTFVNGGTVQFSSDAQLGNSTSGITLNGGQLHNNDSTPEIAATRIITLGSNGGYLMSGWYKNSTYLSSITGTGSLGISWDSGTVTLAGSNSYTGSTTIGTTNAPSWWNNAEANPTLKIAHSNALTGGGALAFGLSPNSNTATLDLAGYSASVGGLTGAINAVITNTTGTLSTLTLGVTSNSSFGGSMAGTIALVKNGSGIETLSGLNTYTGTTTINAGTLQIGNGGTSGTLGSGAVTNNAQLTFNRSDAATISNRITGSGRVDHSGSGTLVLTGNNDYSGQTVIGSSVLQVGSGGTAGSIGTGDVYINDNGVLRFNRSDLVAVTNRITYGGSFQQSGTGTTVLLGNNNDYYGGTTISSGALQIGNGGTNGTIGTGAIVNNASLVFTRSDNYGGDLSRRISGSGSLTVMGGSLILSASNSYSGLTKVGGGALVVNGSIDGAIHVDTAAALKGSGSIAGAATIEGTHGPGNSPGIQSFGSSLSYKSTSTVLLEFTQNSTTGRGTSFDGINVAGDLSFDPGAVMSLTFNGAGSSVNWNDQLWNNYIKTSDGWLLYSVGGTISGLNNLTIAGPFLDSNGLALSSARPDSYFNLYQVGNNVYLNYAIPEPSTYALMGLGALALVVAYRRNRTA